MNLNDFDMIIDEVILSRGLDYYKRGNIVSLDFFDGKWLAEVIGNEDYSVEVGLSADGEILSSECDCPYEFGKYCKHQAAVFYALKDSYVNSVNPPKSKTKNPKSKSDLISILGGQSKETLITLLLEYAENDRLIKKDLLLRFADTKNVEERARNLIKSSVKKAMRRGFVDYGYTGVAVEGAEKVLEMAESMVHSGSPVICAKLLVIVLEEMMDLLDCCDDSNGEVGGVISSAIIQLGAMVSQIDENFEGRVDVFDIITNHAMSKIYDGWSGWRFEMLGLCVPFCNEPTLRSRLEDCLAKIPAGRYDNGRKQELQLRIIADFDGEDAALLYTLINIDNGNFRRTLIEKAISMNEPETALNFCLGGEELDAAYPGFVRQWRVLRYSVHEIMNDVPAQRELARSFVLDGKFDYYPKFKALYSADEWPQVLSNLLLTFDKHNKCTYIKVLIEEDLRPLLMEHCRQNTHAIPSLYRHLVPDFSGELLPLFDALIRKEASQASTRSAYRQVCENIRHLMRACGNLPALTIIDEFLETYKKRPAFADELGKCRKRSVMESC